MPAKDRLGSNPAFRGLPARAEGVRKSDTCSAAVAARTKSRTANSGKILQTPATRRVDTDLGHLEIIRMERDATRLDLFIIAVLAIAMLLTLVLG